MQVCMYVCMYACMHVCLYVCMYVCMCICQGPAGCMGACAVWQTLNPWLDGLITAPSASWPSAPPCSSSPGWLDGCMTAWLHGYRSGWLPVWMSGWLNGWMAGWFPPLRLPLPLHLRVPELLEELDWRRLHHCLQHIIPELLPEGLRLWES
jgi:hypothetical protein